MNKYLPLFLLFMYLGLGQPFSQSYTFSYDSTNYENLQNPTVVFQFFTSGMAAEIPIGFDFPFYQDGLGLVMGDSLRITTNTELWSTDAIVLMNGFWVQDIVDRNFTGATSHVAYELEGSIGQRILKLEWRDLGFSEDTTNSDYMHCQIWYYELDGAIEIHIGPNSKLNPNSYPTNWPVVYMRNSWNFYRVGGDPHAPTINSTDPFTSEPVSGMVYRWAPIGTTINEIESNYGMNLHPNPSSGKISVETYGLEGEIKVSLINTLGEVVIAQIIDSQPLSDFELPVPNGIYFFRIENETRVLTKRILKN